MKRLAIVLIAVLFTTSVVANQHTSKDKDCYEAIKTLIDKELITIKEAQQLWLEYKFINRSKEQ